MRIITFGTFDILHYGHIRILERAKAMGNYLIVGVSSDALNERKKGRKPVYSELERMAIIKALGCVDEVFLEESLELKRDYILQNKADMLVMGNDWEGKFDEFNDVCKVHYFERTPAISTTAIIEIVKSTPL
ncbi:MAG: adenylyltransferase/cytidyltransferase family protein [Venatoribacter sp.]